MWNTTITSSILNKQTLAWHNKTTLFVTDFYHVFLSNNIMTPVIRVIYLSGLSKGRDALHTSTTRKYQESTKKTFKCFKCLSCNPRHFKELVQYFEVEFPHLWFSPLSCYFKRVTNLPCKITCLTSIACFILLNIVHPSTRRQPVVSGTQYTISYSEILNFVF